MMNVCPEGAGGFYPPIARAVLNANLASGQDLPVLVVAADRLGNLNTYPNNYRGSSDARTNACWLDPE